METIINVDASFSPQTKLASWAYWIETADGTFKRSGVFTERMDNSMVTELMAFYMALQFVKNKYPGPLNMVVNTDCNWVVEGLNGKIMWRKTITHRHVKLFESIIRELKEDSVKANHIPSHALRLTTPAQLANNWCDFTAKELLRSAMRRKEIK